MTLYDCIFTTLVHRFHLVLVNNYCSSFRRHLLLPNWALGLLSAVRGASSRERYHRLPLYSVQARRGKCRCHTWFFHCSQLLLAIMLAMRPSTIFILVSCFTLALATAESTPRWRLSRASQDRKGVFLMNRIAPFHFGTLHRQVRW